MMNDVRKLIAMTGQLNRPPFNMQKAENYIRDRMINCLPATLREGFQADVAHHTDTETRTEPLSDYVPDVMDYLSRQWEGKKFLRPNDKDKWAMLDFIHRRASGQLTVDDDDSTPPGV